MKKIFTLLFMGAFYLGFAQLPVSQTQEKKKILLEEHTGKTCGFCPDGHKRAAAIKAADPDNVFLVNIHAGSYASGTPNYRTAFGSAIASLSQLSGYPAGTVNRKYFGYSQQDAPAGATALGRGDWAQAAATDRGEDAIVNVACEASIDVSTNVLTVNVEAYYTGSQQVSTNSLNVALTQDDIWGPQSGAGTFYPENIDPQTGLYKHSHMLRHMLTGQWGETISTISQGDLVSKTYTYTLPATIGDVPVDISKLHVVAFMTESTQLVLNSNGATPTLLNLPNNLEAQLLSLTAPASSCDGIVESKINVRNYGQQDITDMDIVYSVNGITEYTYAWTGGTILPGHNLDIDLPLIGFPVAATNDLDVRIETVNGTSDDDMTNNRDTAVITAVNEHATISVQVDVTLDNYGSEVSWKLYDDNGNVVDSVAVGSYVDNDATLKTKTVNLTALDCFTFHVYDSYGDGLSTGKVDLIAADGSVMTTINGSSYTFTGEYKFAAVDDNGNGNGNRDGSSVNPTGIISINNDFEFTLYPNPANDVIVADYNGEISSIEIVSVIGEVVLSSVSKEINVSKLNSGVYFVKLTNDEGKTVSKSFVKN